MERYRHGAGVVTYSDPLSRGGPIKNARLVAFDGARWPFSIALGGREPPPPSG